MHELAVTKSILDIAQRYAREHKASRVNTIFLRIGVLRNLEPEWLQRYFRFISKGTIAEETEILVMLEPAVFQCNSCQGQFSLDFTQMSDDKVLCPSCAARDYALVSGMEFEISGIEITATNT